MKTKTLPMPQVRFMHWTCDVMIEKYRAGGTALQLINADKESHDHDIATASVWIPGLKKDEIAVPEYKLEGLLKALSDAKIIGPVIRHQGSGFVEIPVCKLLITEDNFGNKA